MGQPDKGGTSSAHGRIKHTACGGKPLQEVSGTKEGKSYHNSWDYRIFLSPSLKYLQNHEIKLTTL